MVGERLKSFDHGNTRKTRTIGEKIGEKRLRKELEVKKNLFPCLSVVSVVERNLI
jgi:hypothetical protein